MRTFLLAALALTACSAPQGEVTKAEPEASEVPDYSGILPDSRIRANMPVNATSRSSEGEVAEYWAFTADAVTDVNTMIDDVVGTIEEIASFDPTWADETETAAFWGPWVDGDNELSMVVIYDEAEDSYDWSLQGRPVGSGDADWTPFVAGSFFPEDEVEGYGSGVFVLDFDAIALLDAGSDEVGIFVVEYTVDAVGADVEAAFQGWNDGGDTVHDVGYVYSQEYAGSGSMDLAWTEDVTGNEVQELQIIRTRWDDAGAGRSDVYLTGGDLGELLYNATECWGSDARVTFYEDNVSFDRSGAAESCVFDDFDYSEEGI